MENLLDAIQSPDLAIRLQAIQSLIQHPDPLSRDHLFTCLKSESVDERRLALQALTSLIDSFPDPAILEGLLKMEPSFDNTMEVAHALAKFGDAGVMRLQSELEQVDPPRVLQAAWALAEMGKLGHLALIETAAKADNRLLQTIDDVLAQIEDPDLEALCLEWLETGSHRQKFVAQRVLGRRLIDPQWIERTLLDEDMFTRVRGMNAFRVISPPNAIPIVTESIRTANGPLGYLVRDIGKIALHSLNFAEVGWQEVVQRLFTAEYPERHGAVWSLTQKRDDFLYILPFLALAVRDYNSYVRSDAVGALIYLDGFEHYADVRATFDDSYSDQDEVLIFIALQQFGLFDLTGDLKEASERQVFNDIPAMLDPVRAARSGIKHLKQLERILLDAWWKGTGARYTRAAINLGLARGRDARGASELIAFYPDLAEEPKMNVLRHLGRLQSSEVSLFLQSLLYREEMPVLWSVCLAIGQQNLARAPGDLIGLLLNTDDLVRLAAVLALGRLADQSSLPSLLALSSDRNPIVRAMAVWAVGCCRLKMPKPGYQDWIVSCSRDPDPWVRMECVRAMLLTRTQWSAYDLLPLLQDTCPTVQICAMRAIEKQPQEDFFPTLLALRGGEVGRAAGHTRQRISGPIYRWQQRQKNQDGNEL